jgi:hypothetical protein
MGMTELKKCNRCLDTKDINNFPPFLNKKNKHWYRRSYCRPCLNKITNERRAKNPIKYKPMKNKRDKDRYWKDIEVSRAYYREAHRRYRKAEVSHLP